jgi:hypothetical protein
MNLQNIAHHHAEQPAKKISTSFRIRVLPLLSHRGWKQLIFENAFISNVFFAMLYSALRN